MRILYHGTRYLYLPDFLNFHVLCWAESSGFKCNQPFIRVMSGPQLHVWLGVSNSLVISGISSRYWSPLKSEHWWVVTQYLTLTCPHHKPSNHTITCWIHARQMVTSSLNLTHDTFELSTFGSRKVRFKKLFRWFLLWSFILFEQENDVWMPNSIVSLLSALSPYSGKVEKHTKLDWKPSRGRL